MTKLTFGPGSAMTKLTFGLCILLYLGCSVEEKTSSGPVVKPGVSDTVVTPKPRPTAEATRRSAPPPRIVKLFVAKFQKNSLSSCVAVGIAVNRPEKPGDFVTLEQAATELLGAFAASWVRGKDASSLRDFSQFIGPLLTDDKTQLARVLMDGLIHRLSKKKRLTRQEKKRLKEVKAMDPAKLPAEELKKVVTAAATLRANKKKPHWPPEQMKPGFKSGAFVKVKSCKFPNRIPLGQCIVADRKFFWMVEQLLFKVENTVDNDAAMKQCLRLGGDWAAPKAGDTRARAETGRQRRRELRGMVESLNKRMNGVGR